MSHSKILLCFYCFLAFYIYNSDLYDLLCINGIIASPLNVAVILQLVPIPKERCFPDNVNIWCRETRIFLY